MARSTVSAQHSPAAKPTPTARPPTRLLLVSNDPALADIASSAAANLHASLDVMPTLDAAIAWLLHPDNLCTHVLAPAALGPSEIDTLAGMVDEITRVPTPLLLLGGTTGNAQGVLAISPFDAGAIETALRALHPFTPPARAELTPGELRTALDGGMLRMRFQPVVDTITLRPLGLEALARIHHPRLGILRPQHFMPQAIAGGLEKHFATVAAARVLIELRGMAELHAGHVAFNMPMTRFVEPDAPERARELLTHTRLPPERVVVELVESMERPDLPALAAAVARWRATGFLVTIDDAGPGLPHWRQMMDLPFSGVKLDGRLARQTAACDDQAAKIVDVAHRRGLYIVAEGIEDKSALTRMRALGVQALQGFLFCRPLPARALPIWLAQTAA
jgi:EAL domain-containing protein (putative c-di-GMP-specific phosphodiesterase class I)